MSNGVDSSVGIVKDPINLRDSNKEDDILREAVKRATAGYDYWKYIFNKAEENVKFIYGDQYDQDDLNQKLEDNRIAMTFNKLPQFINKVVGAQRSSVQTIKVSPTGLSIGHEEPKFDTGSGKKGIPLSSVLTDLIRDIEYQSNAVAWYKMSFKQALEGGFGFLRVLTQYQDDGFDLDIRIKGIRDRWSVIVDPNAVESDLSDMNWCFINEKMSLDEFRKRYPGKSYDAIPGADTISALWSEDDTVTVSEYFRREAVTKEIVLMSDNKSYYSDELDKLMGEMAANGIVEVKRRKITTYKVIWCKISQSDILEPDIEFPTSTIPVIPVFGRENDLRGKRVYKGLIDDAIDAQIALNKMRSSAIERIDSSPLSPFIATDKSIEGRETMWRDANITRYSTLVYKKGEDRPKRDYGATIPTAELQITGVLDGDMKESIGIFNASLGATSNEISGRAIEARQSEADVGTYEFLDNYKNAIRRVGILITEMIPIVYDTNRIVRIRGIDGNSDTIEINKVLEDIETGKNTVVNCLDHGKHTVVISTGASYETNKQKNADQILELMRINPQVAQVGSDLLVDNLDFSDSNVLAERLQKMIPPEYLSKEKREQLAEDRPEPQPTMEQIKFQSDLQMKQMDLEAKKFDLEAKIELEKIKYDIAQLNLEKSKIELLAKQNNENDHEPQNNSQIVESNEEIARAVADSIGEAYGV